MTNTRENLIELIRKADKEDYTSATQDQHYEFMADHLIANGVTVQEWISASEPPKKDGRYLVAKKIFNKVIWQEVLSFAKDGRKVDKYDFHREWKNVWYLYDGEWGHSTIDDVTHWMPLPQPPKEEL